MKKLLTEWRKFLNEDKKSKEDFKPHMMYNPKTGKGIMAKTYERHIELDKKGYLHDKPKVKEDKMADLDAEQAYSTKVKGVNVIVNLKDTDLQATKHSKERQFRHDEKISNRAIIQAVELSIGKVIQDYANGELANDEPFHIRMVGKGRTPPLNVIAVLNMQKGPDTIKVITVMRKDDFQTDNFAGGQQKTYTVQTR